MKLKKLLLSLFGLFAFTPFVLADSIPGYNQSYYFTPGITQIFGNYGYTFDNYGNMLTDNGTDISDSAFYQCGSYSYSVFHNYSWLNGKLYYYSEGNNGTITQGFVNNWCVSDFDNPGSCYAGSFDVSWDNVKSNIGNITSVVYGSNSLDWGSCSSNSPYLLCFGDGSNYYCANCNNNSNYLVCGLSDSMNFDFNGFNDISSYNWGYSPFSYSGGGGVSTGSINSAQNLYDSYRALGYQDVMCYGGFSLDDLLLTGNSRLNDLQVGSGATIFQLHQAYSGGMELGQWWNHYDFDYGFLVDYNEYEPFIGKSKGLVGLFMVRDTFFKRNDFDINMLLGFCALSLTNNNIDRSKTPIDMIHDTVLNNELGKLIGDFGIIVPVSGSALDIVANSISGVNELSDLWDNGYNIFTRFQLVHSGNEGILPGYIIVGLLSIIILYLLRK